MLLVALYLLIPFLAFCSQPYLATTPFRLFAKFESEPPETVRSAIREQIAWIFAPTGWTVEWADLNNAGRLSASVAVAKFRGTCNVDDLMSLPSPVRKLGRTHVSNGILLKFVDIYCDAIRASIAAQLALMNPGAREAQYGRAVGRVLAHELYHALTGDKNHGSRGVAQARFSPEELLADNLQFGLKEVQKLRLKLTPVLLSAYKWPSTPASTWRRGARLFISSGCQGCHGVLGEGTQWGPALRNMTMRLHAQELAARLNRADSEMYRRARTMNVLWPSLPADEIEELVRYLNGMQYWTRAAVE